jgi:hypothetical protein
MTQRCGEAASGSSVKPIIFIHTNDQQLLAAKMSAYSLKSRSRSPEEFEVRLLRLEETPHLYQRDNQRFTWSNGNPGTWLKRDLQSFAPLRRMVPQILSFEGRALVLDPDVLAVGDVHDLLCREMGGKAILCRKRVDRYQNVEVYASSVMLLDCAKLSHWQWDRDIDDLFSGRLEMGPWLALLTEAPERIGIFEEEWNHFDTLNEKTKLLHNTERSTQPWKTGLPVDFDLDLHGADGGPAGAFPLGALRRMKRRFFSNRAASDVVYQPHPDPRQVRFFFSLLKECLEQRILTEDFLRGEIRKKHLRKDAFKILETS